MTNRFAWVAYTLCLGGLLFVTIQFLGYRWDQKKIAPASEMTPVSVSAFIVPHHLLVRDEIDQIFQFVSDAIRGESIERVIVLSPNHFDVGRTWIVGSARSWDTPSGVLSGDVPFLETLRGTNTTIGDDILEREHGVRDLLPFVKQHFPRATIVPLALRDGIPDDTADELADLLHSEATQKRSLLIVSADFSHYLDWNFSRYHDDRSIEALEDFNLEQVKKLDVDCAGCLRVALKYAQAVETGRFYPMSRTSSLELMGKNLIGEETSHVTGYFSNGDEPRQAHRTADLFFSGSIRPEMMAENARRLFMSQDGNVFRIGDETVYSRESFLPHQQGFVAGGEPLIRSLEENSTVREINGVSVAFVGIREFLPWSETLLAVDKVKKESDFVVAYWQHEQDNQDEWRRMSYALVDAGADMVVGGQKSHAPSVELYRHKALFSTIGDTAQCQIPKKCLTLTAGVSVTSQGTEYFLMPVVTDQVVTLAPEPERSAFLELLSLGEEETSLRESLRGGRLTLTGGE